MTTLSHSAISPIGEQDVAKKLPSENNINNYKYSWHPVENDTSLPERLKYHDNLIREKIAAGLQKQYDPLPNHLEGQLQKWEENLTSSQDIAMLKEVKRQLVEGHTARAEYTHSQTVSKIDRMQLEIAMKGLSKTMSGIQQLLSAQ